MFKKLAPAWSRFPARDFRQSVQTAGAVSLVLLLAAASGFADRQPSEIELPWEPEDLRASDPLRLENRFQSPSLLNSLARPAIHFYRRRIASQSIDRCPFHVSCSHFAEKAVERFGFLRGTALFIDRHFFREHAGARQLYTLRETWRDNRIKLKLDDSFYLSDRRDEVAE